MKKLIYIFPLFFVLAFAQNLWACTCGYTPSACKSYSAADAVFTGYVKYTTGERRLGTENIDYVRVEKVFKGSVPRDVRFVWGSTSCDMGLEQGERWLLYARKIGKDGTSWEISVCDGSHTIASEGNGDLKYLNNLEKNKGLTRLSGRYFYQAGVPIQNAKIEVFGKDKKYELTTDNYGFFELYGLPNGSYYLKPTLLPAAKLHGSHISGKWASLNGSPLPSPPPFPAIPPPPPMSGMKPEPAREIFTKENSAEIEIGEEKCVEVDFTAETKNSVKGKIENADGKSVEEVCVSLLKVENNIVSTNNQIKDCYINQGEFLIYGFPAGQYVISVNKASNYKIDFDKNFPTLFYPDTTLKDKAKVLTFADDDNFDDVKITIPADHPLKIVEGVLSYADGSAAANEEVIFTYWKGKQRKTIETRTDRNGKFSVSVLKGTRGSLKGQKLIHGYESEKCPALKKYVYTEDSYAFVPTKQKPLFVSENIENIKLAFSFTPCEKDE